MNCQQFTTLIVEAARGRMMDASARDGAMRHADACAACAARLAQEQSLTAALRAVALDMKDLSAPASVEAKLLAAFQESLAPSNASAATNVSHAPLQTSVAPSALASLRTRRFAWVATAIAASLVLAALAALYTQFAPSTTPSSHDLASNNGKTEHIKASPPVNAATISTPPLASSDESTAPPEGAVTQAGQRVKPQRSQGKLARGATPRMITASQVIDGGSAIIEADEGEASRVGASAANGAARPSEPESMTDFISLVADATPATPLEGGQLVRVQVPRAALASLGLPLNAERGNEPVKADVLVGYDGLARAIRFVR